MEISNTYLIYVVNSYTKISRMGIEMKLRRAVGLTHCPNCGARIVPAPKEFKQRRKASDFSQRQMAYARLNISAAHVAYLRTGNDHRARLRTRATGNSCRTK